MLHFPEYPGPAWRKKKVHEIYKEEQVTPQHKSAMHSLHPLDPASGNYYVKGGPVYFKSSSPPKSQSGKKKKREEKSRNVMIAGLNRQKELSAQSFQD